MAGPFFMQLGVLAKGCASNAAAATRVWEIVESAWLRYTDSGILGDDHTGARQCPSVTRIGWRPLRGDHTSGLIMMTALPSRWSKHASPPRCTKRPMPRGER